MFDDDCTSLHLESALDVEWLCLNIRVSQSYTLNGFLTYVGKVVLSWWVVVLYFWETTACTTLSTHHPYIHTNVRITIIVRICSNLPSSSEVD